MSELTEPILVENPNRFTLFPIEHQDLWEFYNIHFDAFWKPSEIPFNEDIEDWENKLSDNDRYFIKNILAFFASSDGIVNENITENFVREVQYTEAKFFYGFQIMMENIHSHTYSLMIDTYVKDKKEKDSLFNAIHEIPAVKKKADWALKWINSDSFTDRLLAFIAVEMIFFSGSFCSIYWLKSKGLMDSLSMANHFISRDENLHGQFAIHLLNHHIVNKPSQERIKEIFLSALEIENEFITESLPVTLIGMNSNLMKQYLQFILDNLFSQLGCKKIFNVKNPFSFMEQILLDNKTNFFEKKASEYQLSKISNNIKFDEEF